MIHPSKLAGLWKTMFFLLHSETRRSKIDFPVKGMSYHSDDREIRQFLREQLDAARIEYTAASAEFDLMVKDVLSGIPQPDGPLRINKAGEASRAALQNYMRVTDPFLPAE